MGANLREENLGDGGKYVGVVANKLAPYEFFFWRKHRIAVQKKIANMTVLNFPHSVLWAFVKSMVLSFSANPTKRPTGVRNKKKQDTSPQLAVYFWRHSLGVLYGLVKTIFPPE